MVALGAGVAVWQFWGGLPFAYSYSCSRSGQRSLGSSEQFVRAHLPDASGFEVWTYDCDSGGPAFLGFKTSAAPAATRDALLTDRSCRQVDLEGDEGEYVDCALGGIPGLYTSAARPQAPRQSCTSTDAVKHSPQRHADRPGRPSTFGRLAAISVARQWLQTQPHRCQRRLPLVGARRPPLGASWWRWRSRSWAVSP